jgi:hypothetical protein
MNEKLLANIRFSFAQCVFNNKCHYKAVERLDRREFKFRIIVGVLSTLSMISLLFLIIGQEEKYAIFIKISSYLGLLVTVVSIILQFFNRPERIQLSFQHKQMGEKYKTIRDEYSLLITDLMGNLKNETELIQMRDKLQIRYSNLGENAPEITQKDYKNAQMALGIYKSEKQEYTWPENEIDKFLPESLRMSK